MPTLELMALFFTSIIILIGVYRYRERICIRPFSILIAKHLHTPTSLHLLWMIRAGIVILIFLLWYDPHISVEKVISKNTDNSVIIALDISKSMQADDISPSRIERAKSVIDTFIKNNTDTSFGFVIFAGKTFLMSPPSRDISGLRALVKSITTDTINQNLPDTSGTNIGDAIMQSIETLKSSEKGTKNIILMTDGRANIGIEPMIAAKEAKKYNITISTIGIGSASGEALSYIDFYGKRQYFYDTNGTRIQADRDDVLLGNIAKETGGRYLIGNEGISLENSMITLGESIIEKPEIDTTQVKIPLSPVLFFMIILLIPMHGIVGFYIRKKYNPEKNLHF